MEKESSDWLELKERLRRQSRLLERLQRIGQIGSWELNTRTRSLTWTDETYRIHGVSRSSYSPTLESAINFYTPQARPLIRHALNAASNQGVGYDLELPLLRKDGVLRWIRATGRRADEAGNLDLLCGVFQDITERRLLEHEIINIAQRERTLIGFDLHDGLSQELTGMSLTLSGILSKIPKSADRFREELRGVETSMRAAINTCRELAQGLSPTGRERGGLVGAVRELATRMEKPPALRLKVRTRGGDWGLDDASADHLYRIAQEAVSNAIKHGHARRIIISLASSPTKRMVSIVNDHHGVAAKATDGMGLKIMHFRARLLGATLSIRSLPSGGMRVRCCLPKAAEE